MKKEDVDLVVRTLEGYVVALLARLGPGATGIRAKDEALAAARERLAVVLGSVLP